VSTWADETGNGYDLTTGTAPTYKTSVIGGNPIVRFDGVDDLLDVSFSALSQPNTIYGVIQLQDQTGDTDNIWATTDTGARQGLQETRSGNFAIVAGTELSDGSADTNPHIIGALYNGSNSTVRLDGSQTASGNAGTQSMRGFRLGDGAFTGNHIAVDVGEILIYPQDKSSSQSSIESYLSDKWGVTI
jgi:hypothetical protein